MFWDQEYKDKQRVWGEGPGELAVITVEYLRGHGMDDEPLHILDVGCGYGRDARYLSANLNCNVTGVDSSEKAVGLATSCSGAQTGVRFVCGDFAAVEGAYDVVYAANLYQVLEKGKRDQLRGLVKEVLKPGGLLFLNTLSTNDPEEYGKGVPVQDDADSFRGAKFLHFTTEEELRSGFDFLEIEELREHAYEEPHEGGPTHHHIAWVLIGKKPGK